MIIKYLENNTHLAEFCIINYYYCCVYADYKIVGTD